MKLRDAFEFSADCIHLNNAGTAPLTKAARDKLVTLSQRLCEQGAHFIPPMNVEVAQARKLYADFLGTTPDRVAFTANLATSVSMVARSLPFRSGDRILSIDQEYPSNAYIWFAVARDRQLQFDLHASEPDSSIRWDRFIDSIRPGTRAVVISWVQFNSGVTAPLRLISEACRRVGAWLIVDAIQGLGVLPFDLRKEGVDIVCGGSHKWLCGFTGHGFLAFKDDLFMEMEPVLQGALTFGTPDERVDPTKKPLPRALRFEPGSPAHVLILACAASLQVLMEYGIQKTRDHAMQMTQHLAQELHHSGVQILGEKIEAKQSPLVTFAAQGKIQKIHEALNARKISHAYRWETVRLSPHGFTTRDELDQAIAVIRSAL